MTIHDRILALFNVHRGEEQLIGILLAWNFLEGLAAILIYTVAQAIFVAEFGATNLPFAYIGVAIFATLVSALFLRATSRFSLGKVALGSKVFMIVLLLGLSLALAVTDGPWVTFSLPVAYGALNTLMITARWAIIGRVLDLQQTKRLTGLLDSGQIVAHIIGGFLLSILVVKIGTTNILLLAAFILIGSAILLFAAVRLYSDRLDSVPKVRGKDERKRTGSPLKQRYVLFIVANFALFSVGIYFVDNIFYTHAELQYLDQESLSSFIGLFWGVASILILLMQLFLTGRMLTRFGVGMIMLLTPLAITFEGTLMAIAGTVAGITFLLFSLAVLTNLTRVVLDAADLAATNVLFQPLPEQLRTQSQSIVTGMVYPISIGVAGVGLLFCTRILGLDVIQLTYVLVGIGLPWIGAALLLGRAYPKALMRAIGRRDFGSTQYLVTDQTSLTVLEQSVNSSNIGVVEYSLNLLEEVEPDAILAAVPGLLSHPLPQVRMDILARTERLGLTSALPMLRERFEIEPLPVVKGHLVRSLAVLGGSENIDRALAYLEDPEIEVRRGALIGLLRNGSLEAILSAGSVLTKAIESDQASTRRFAAGVLGEGGIAAFYRPVERLIQDPDPWVQKSALVAAGRLRHAALWPAVVGCLDSRFLRADAMNALASGGAEAVSATTAGFARYARDRQATLRLIRTLGRIGGLEALQALEKQMDVHDEEIYTQLLVALHRSDYRAQGDDRGRIERQLQEEAAHGVGLAAALVALADDDRCSMLYSTLAQHLARARMRMALLLSFIYDREAMARTIRVLGLDRPLKGERARDLPDARRRSYALETLEVLLPFEQRRVMLPFLGGSPPVEIVAALDLQFPQESKTCEQYAQGILEADGKWFTPWARAAALETVARLPAPELVDVVRANLNAGDALVRESALWTLYRLGGRPPAALQNRTRQGRESHMLSTVEKVIALKGLRFFARTPDEFLAEVAGELEEQSFDAGEDIIAKGEPGDSLYIIVEGKVRIHDDETVIGDLGLYDAFGEFALLDPAPRSATVTALEDSILLLLDQNTFNELIDDHGSVARNIMQDLVRRIRFADMQSRPGLDAAGRLDIGAERGDL
jgi:HEAT repeat protein